MQRDVGNFSIQASYEDTDAALKGRSSTEGERVLSVGLIAARLLSERNEAAGAAAPTCLNWVQAADSFERLVLARAEFGPVEVPVNCASN